LRTSKNFKENVTALQAGGLTEQRNQLSTRIRVWQQLQPIYMPGLLQYKSDMCGGIDTATPHPEDVDLWLPSKLSKEVRHIVCIQDLPTIEEKLRTAQCHEALDSIRNILKIKSRLVKFKHNNVRGQREGTRSRAIIDRVHERARAAAAKYRTARATKLLLSGSGEWEQELQVLEDADIRAYQDPNKLVKKKGRPGTVEDGQISSNVPARHVEEAAEEFNLFPDERTRRDGTGETRRTLSWIWLTGTAHGNQDGDEVLQIEWCKSRARAARAKEEVRLVKEEMRRVVEFLKWKSEWWHMRAEHCLADGGIAEGLRAYAQRQSLLQDNLSQHFQAIWKAPLSKIHEGVPMTEENEDGTLEDTDEEENGDVDDEDAIMDD